MHILGGGEAALEPRPSHTIGPDQVIARTRGRFTNQVGLSFNTRRCVDGELRRRRARNLRWIAILYIANRLGASQALGDGGEHDAREYGEGRRSI